ncbi:efflux transporter outer membrane subunit [Sphingobium sp. RAC03]|uniref:efflux transporter outer membrane subunit n=1 Tax=Sphingobium sp. RAC03 TaxID=1843368 RepID=UPI00083E3E12|nr:efflux transporter outer membrane subunit [Sphingobium sp. RAC03]AOF96225.1 efflux transporter, outer membrane factor (OMF) lipo, NodT family protein [Sphingobium sp. RAC03]
MLSCVSRRVSGTLVLCILPTLGACASVPNLGPTPSLTSQSALTTDPRVARLNAAWPTDRWWTDYGDAQLDRLIEEGTAGSPTLAAAQARLRRAQGLAQQAGASLMPSVSGTASLSETKQSYNNGVPAAFAPQGWNEAASANLSFSYEFDFFGRNRASLVSATSETFAARAEVEQSRLTLTTSIANYYAQLLGQWREIDLAVETVRIRQSSADLVTRRRSQGLETVAAVGQANSALESAQANEESLREQARLIEYQIAALLGAGPGRAVDIRRPTEPMLHAVGLPAGASIDLIARRPDIVAALRRVEARAADVRVARAGFYPSVSLSALIGQQVLGLGNFFNAGSRYGSAGPSISLPIFQGGRLSGEYRTAQAQFDEAVATYNDTLVNALQNVASTVTSQQSLTLQLGHATRAQAEAERAYRAANDRYRGGLSNYIDVLTAENTLISARRSVSQLQTRAFTLDVALVRALGGGFHTA